MDATRLVPTDEGDLQHYRSPSSVGTRLMASMEHVQLEAGFNDCPLNRPFEPLGPLTTRCWVRSLWESLNYCGVKTVDCPRIPLPQTGDKLLSDFFVIHCKELSGIIGKAAMTSKLAGLQ